jgi:hypothetical protein
MGVNLDLDPSTTWNHIISTSFVKLMILSHNIFTNPIVTTHEMYSHVLGTTHNKSAIFSET